MKAQSKHFWNEIYRVRKNAMRLRVAKTLQVYRFVSFYQTVISYRAAPRYDFHSQARKNHAEQPPQIAVKAQLFITAKAINSSTRGNVSASEP